MLTLANLPMAQRHAGIICSSISLSVPRECVITPSVACDASHHGLKWWPIRRQPRVIWLKCFGRWSSCCHTASVDHPRGSGSFHSKQLQLALWCSMLFFSSLFLFFSISPSHAFPHPGTLNQVRHFGPIGSSKVIFSFTFSVKCLKHCYDGINFVGQSL